MRPVPAIEAILSTPALWRGRHGGAEGRRVLSSGWPELDALLPASGWPLGSLIEIGIAAPGCGECALFFPLWTQPPATIDPRPRAKPGSKVRTGKPRRQALAAPAPTENLITLIDPPFLPYAPGWRQRDISLSRLWWISTGSERQRLWAAEQSLRSGVCSAVLLWPQQIQPNALRRLQLAAESSNALGLCFRPEQELAQPSHAPIRLHLRASAASWNIELIKCRGRTGGAKLVIPREPAAPKPAIAAPPPELPLQWSL